MIICDRVSKEFPGGGGIRDISLQFEPGKVYGIIGANGAGKTTLLRCLEGLYGLSGGSVTHDGVSTTGEKAFKEIRQHISYLPTEDYLYPGLSCRENILLASMLRGGGSTLSADTEELIRLLGAGEFLDKPFDQCSTGMKKKAQIIASMASLAGDIRTLIWDEPNDGLDIMANIRIKELLAGRREKGNTVIVSSHVIEFLEHFIDICIIIHEGRILDIRDGREIPSLAAHYLDLIGAQA